MSSLGMWTLPPLVDPLLPALHSHSPLMEVYQMHWPPHSDCQCPAHHKGWGPHDQMAVGGPSCNLILVSASYVTTGVHGHWVCSLGSRFWVQVCLPGSVSEVNPCETGGGQMGQREKAQPLPLCISRSLECRLPPGRGCPWTWESLSSEGRFCEGFR